MPRLRGSGRLRPAERSRRSPESRGVKASTPFVSLPVEPVAAQRRPASGRNSNRSVTRGSTARLRALLGHAGPRLGLAEQGQETARQLHRVLALELDLRRIGLAVARVINVAR